MSMIRSAVQVALLLWWGMAAGQSASQARAKVATPDLPNPCGSSLETNDGYGPFDYRTRKDKLPMVENAHFTPGVEQFFERKTSFFGADIGYTLYRFPNHHRALEAMMRLSKRERTDKPRGATYPVECYFERALRFRGDDVVARMLYAEFLVQRSRNDDALAQLQIIRNVAGDNAMTHYNLGMIYVDAKRNDIALAEAHKAMALGLQWPGLRDKLVKVGAWAEPAADKPVAAPMVSPAGNNPIPATAAPAASAP